MTRLNHAGSSAFKYTLLVPHCLLIAILALSLPATGQDCTSYVVVNAYEQRLHLDIETLKADDFEAKTGGSELPIISSKQDYNTRLLVLLEVDGQEQSKIGEIVDTVSRMAQQAPEGKPVAFGIYAGRAIFTKGFITDPDKRKAEIGAVMEEADSLGKRVALYESLHEALKLFGEHQAGDTVLLVGNPYDDRGGRSSDDVGNEYLKSGVRLLVMLRESLSDVGRDSLTNSHSLEKRMFSTLPELTGGAYTDFDPHFFGFTWRGYMLAVKVPDGVRKPRKWHLRLRRLLERSFSHSKLYYPQTLPACQRAEAKAAN